MGTINNSKPLSFEDMEDEEVVIPEVKGEETTTVDTTEEVKE